MTRLLWHSVAPFCPTGYGTQTALFAPRLNKRDDTEVAISCGFGLEGSGIRWGDIWLYPSPGGRTVGESWSRNAYQWTTHYKADLVVTLLDVWPLHPEIFAEINKVSRLACWTPVDHKPVPPPVVEFFTATSATPIAMSKFGEEELRAAGLDPLYVPHGVDTNIFKPLDDRAEMRESLGFDKDSFIVGIVANNQGQSPPRKAFSESFLAFSIFRETHPDAVLYLHCEMTGYRNGLDLWRMAERFEIPPEAMKVVPAVLLDNGVPQETMAGLYSVMDVLLNPSYGEGFGIPIIEAQACGTPVIITDWTAMSELCGAGWKVGGTLWDHAQAEAYWLKPDVDQLVGALKQAYQARSDDKLRQQARGFACRYNADLVMDEYWAPVLEQLTRPREVQPLRPNREMRRAAAKQKAVA